MAVLSDAPSEWSQQTQSKEKPDWTHFLSAEATVLLRSILESAYKHRSAYFKAEDIKTAQLWSAILELKRELNEINQKLDRLTPKQKETFKMGLQDSGPAMQLIKRALQPTVNDSREAKDALIESLMRF